MSLIDHLWVEKYRPKTIDDVVLPHEEKEKLKEYLSKEKIPHLAFYGPPGTGKSSLARVILKAICKSDDDYICLNASLHGRIDTVRNIILPFLKTPPLASKQKIIYFEEFDNTSIDAQLALREPIEAFSDKSAFILTFNYINRIDDAILSRFQVFSVSAPPIEDVIQRCEYILQNENVTYDKSSLESLVVKLYPKLRDIIKALQKFTVNGKFEYNEDIAINEFDAVVREAKQILLYKFQDYKTERRAISALVTNLSNIYVDYAAIMQEIAKSNDLPIEIRLEAAGFVDSIARSVAPELAFMNAIWKLLGLKHQLMNQGLL